MSSLKKSIAFTLLLVMVSPLSSVDALTLQQTVNTIQATDPALPIGVANPKGYIGSLLSELFWGSVDGTKNGKIKPQYIDYAGFSSWTQSGSNAFYSGTGNVGIGTTNPGAALNVIKTTEQMRLGYDASSYLSAIVDSNGAATLYSNGVNRNLNISTNYGGMNGTVAASFGYYNGYNGITTPYLRSDLVSTSRITSGNTISFDGYSNGYNFDLIGYNAGAFGGGYFVYSSKLPKESGVSTERLRLHTNGNFGFYNSNPQYTVDINGSFNVSSGFVVKDTGNVGIWTSTPSDLLTLSGATSTLVNLNGATTNYRGLKMSNTSGTEQWFAGANNLNNYVIRQGGTTDIMTFSGGNVGIGTTAPGARVHSIGGAAGSSISGTYTGGGVGLQLGVGWGYGSTLGSGGGNFPGGAGGIFIGGNHSTIGGGGAGLYAQGGVGTPTGGGTQGEGGAGIYAVGGVGGAGIGPAGYFSGNIVVKGLDSLNTSFAANISGSTGIGLVVTNGGNVWIGISSPSMNLDVVGSAVFRGTSSQIRLYETNAANPLFAWHFSLNNGDLTTYYGDDATSGPYYPVMTQTNAGNVGIGTTTPGTYKLYVNGTGYLGAAAWVYASDRRLKENITPLKYGMDEIMKLSTKKFDYIQGEKNNLGFIAQDVQKIFPELVTTQPSGMLGLKTDMIIPVLVNAVQELETQKDAEIQDLKKQNQDLKFLVCLDHPSAEICK